MLQGPELNFKYSGLFQNVHVRIFSASESGGKQTVSVEADVKLPILKKSFVTSTAFDNGQWTTHYPVVDASGPRYEVLRTKEHGDALDPISFLLTLDRAGWAESTVKLLVGKKVIELDVVPVKNGYEIKRRDKDQRLIVRKDSRGISAIEIPVPIIGTVSMKRI